MATILTHTLETSDLAALLKIAEELNDAKNKDQFEDNLDILESLIHDVWAIRTSGSTARIVNTDLAERLAVLAENSGSSDLPGWLAEIATIRENLIVNINKKIAADALFVSMSA